MPTACCGSVTHEQLCRPRPLAPSGGVGVYLFARLSQLFGGMLPHGNLVLPSPRHHIISFLHLQQHGLPLGACHECLDSHHPHHVGSHTMSEAIPS